MGVYRFEDLRVWQAARQQCDRVGKLIIRPEFRSDRPLSNQMNAASISVMFNISEGFLRRIDSETLQFLRYAFASNGELKAGYYVASGRGHITPSETTEFIELNESIAKMLRKWQTTLEVHREKRKRGAPGQRTKDRTKNKEPLTKNY